MTKPRVPMIDESDAEGVVAGLYDHVRRSFGTDFVPDMFRLLSTRPEMLEAVLKGYQAMFADGLVDRRTKETVAAWTARLNECPYCVSTHNTFVLMFGGTKDLTDAILKGRDVEALPLDDVSKAAVRWAELVTLTPWKVTDADWQAASSAGWSEDQLLEITFTAAMFNSITRLVDALGLGVTTVSRTGQLAG